MSRTKLDLTLYLVTDTRQAARLGLTETVRRAVAGGVGVVQLRDHELTDDEFVDLGRAVRAVLDGTGVPLLVDDRVHLVEAIGAQGAHVGQADMDPVEARRVLGPDAYLGLSCTSVEQVEDAVRLPAGTLDYLGLGPVRATPTKPDHAPPVGIDGVTELARVSPLPGVGIGGIDAELAAELSRRTALRGVAVVSAVCAAEDPTSAARALRDAFEHGQAR